MRRRPHRRRRRGRRRLRDRHAAARRRHQATSWSGTARAACRPTTPRCRWPRRAGRAHQPAQGARRPCTTGSRAPTCSSASARPTCSTPSGSRTWQPRRSSSRWPTPTPRSIPPRPTSTPPWSPAAAPTTPTRSTTCWRSPASSAACSTPVPRRSPSRCCCAPPTRSPTSSPTRSSTPTSSSRASSTPPCPRPSPTAIREGVADSRGSLTSLAHSLGDFTATTIDGKDIDLSAYGAGGARGQRRVAVRHTPQYAGLQELYDDLRRPGLHGAGLPVRPVRPPGARHRGRDRDVLRDAYGVTFPMFAKIDVNGDERPPALRLAALEQAERPAGP